MQDSYINLENNDLKHSPFDTKEDRTSVTVESVLIDTDSEEELITEKPFTKRTKAENSFIKSTKTRDWYDFTLKTLQEKKIANISLHITMQTHRMKPSSHH